MRPSTFRQHSCPTPDGLKINFVTPHIFADGTGIGGGRIGASASLTKDGPGTLIVQTANFYTGPTTIKNGTLQIGSGSIGDIGTGNVTNNGTLIFGQGDAQVHVVSGVVGGTGSLTQQGSATTVLAQNNTYSGATTISGGVLQLGNGGAPGSVNAAFITNNASLALNRTGAFTFTNGVTGSGQLIKFGSGAATITANLTYQGNTYISNGIIKLGAAEQIPDANSVSGSTGWLILDGGSTGGTFDLNVSAMKRSIALSGVAGTVNGLITNSGASTAMTNKLIILGGAASNRQRSDC